MLHTLFNAIKLLEQKLTIENIDIHQTKKELYKIVNIGRENNKLRIVTRFVSFLEVLSQQYEYEDGQTISHIKNLIKNSLQIILSMVNGELSNTDGATQMNKYTKEAQDLLRQKIELTPFLYDSRLIYQYIFDIRHNLDNIKEVFQRSLAKQQTKKGFETVKYYLQKIHDDSEFIGLNNFVVLTKSLKIFVEREYHHNRFWEIFENPDMILSMEYFERRLQFIEENINNKHLIAEHFEENKPTKLANRLAKQENEISQATQSTASNNPNITLTLDEINALMDDQENFETISFDQKEDFNDDVIVAPTDIFAMNSKKPAMQILQNINMNEIKNIITKDHKNIAEYEDILIKLAGKLFLKQEQLKELLPEESKVLADSDLKELDTITRDLKEMLFERYYISIEDLLGDTLRTYIRQEVQNLGKKIRLGIRGEKSEILTRESEFIKEIVFALVRNSLNYSLEMEPRRKAVDKSAIAWLLIEFEDAGDKFDIYVRDDGRGLIADLMEIETLKEKIAEKNGILEIDSVENEYLKVHVQIPMKRIIIDALVVSVGDMNVLIPNKCIQNIISPKELPMALKEEFCIGEVNLAPILGLSNSTANMFVICQLGEDIIIFGVEKILYNIETLVENTDIPLIPCASDVVIIKDGSIGFLIDERELYKQSKKLIEQRAKIITANTVI